MSIQMFRTLRADEIECRVQSVSKKGCSVLLYKDARCDMTILDETVYPAGWMREHLCIDGNLYCRVGIAFDSGWVWKMDVGTESNTEKEKGQASDSFKRACVNWGIGRELYTAPFIWVPGELLEWRERDGKQVLKTTFAVDYIDYDDKRRICSLAIRNEHGKIVWTFGTKSPAVETPTEQAHTETPVPLCQICGKPVKSAKSKGVTYTPEEVLRRLGGMCKDCYRDMNNAGANS